MTVDWSSLRKRDDWWANWVGFLLFALCAIGLIGVIYKVPRFVAWGANPFDSMPVDALPRLAVLLFALVILYSMPAKALGERVIKYIPAFVIVFLIACVSFVISKQTTIAAWGLEYPLWAIAIGLVIANTVGVPNWLKPGIKTELYIKTGLVLLGAEILFGRILALGPPGIVIAWGVTPFVLAFMYFLGTRVLRLDKALTVTIAAGTSVCGVSAAVAAAAAVKARKEYLTITLAMVLITTVLLMFGVPAIVMLVGMDEVIAGGWIGGVVESTGAVVAAGELVGPRAMEVAVVVKMIQNLLIGVFAFFIATVWITRVEKTPGAPKPSLAEIWYRAPKFIVGFVGLSLVTSFILTPTLGEEAVGVILGGSSSLRNYFFCLAFVSIGLESNFRELGKLMAGGKVLALHLAGIVFNLLLTLLVAYLMLGIVFPMPA